MENVMVSNEQGGKARTLIKHPIVQFYEREVSQEMKSCPCTDCDPCDYEAR